MIDIIQGTDRTILIRLKSKSTRDPFDLTGATVVVHFKNEDGTCLVKAATIVSPATAGKISVTLDETETALLKVGEAQDFEVQIDIGSNTTVVQLLNALNIIERIC